MTEVMKLEIIMLNENSLSYNEEYCGFSFTYRARVEGMAVKDTIKNVDGWKVTEVNTIQVHCFIQLAKVGTI